MFIKHYGYETEIHNVTTEDGYKLKLFRCYSKKALSKKNKPVLLAHGNWATSDLYVIHPRNESLGNLNTIPVIIFLAHFGSFSLILKAYFLSDAGHDVWLSNSRGNYYSRAHVSKDPDDPNSGFWNFSWTEMATFDHPATVDYIINQTGHSTVNYIGHSQGATTLLVFLAQRPEYNAKINIASILAPITFLQNSGYLTQFSYEFYFLFWVGKFVFDKYGL